MIADPPGNLLIISNQDKKYINKYIILLNRICVINIDILMFVGRPSGAVGFMATTSAVLAGSNTGVVVPASNLLPAALKVRFQRVMG
jgi:hypothetical protein